MVYSYLAGVLALVVLWMARPGINECLAKILRSQISWLKVDF